MRKILPLIIFLLSLMSTQCSFTQNKQPKEMFFATFYLDDEIYLEIPVYGGEQLQKPEDPVKTGSQFARWELDGEEYDFSTPITNDIKLVGLWKEDLKYEVVFYVNDKVHLTITALEGETIKAPNDPYRKGYSFLGWECNGKSFDFSTPITEDLKLVSQWEKLDLEIFDIILMDGEKQVDIISIDEGDVLNDLKYVRMTKDFYTFLGWFDEAGNKIDETYIPQCNMTLYAKWEALGEIFVLELDGNPKEYLEGTEYTLPTRVKAGYVNVGWANEDLYVVTGPIIIDRDIKLTSLWKPVGTEGKSYSLNLEGVKVVDIVYLDGYRLPTVSKLGYEFVCWTDGTYKYESGYEYIVAEDSVLTPILNKLDRGDDYSNLAFTLSNLDVLYQEINFPLTADIKLPTTDPSTGATIEWLSSDESVITDTGEITRVLTSEHVSKAILTATVTYNGEKEIREFEFTIKRELKDISKGVVAGYFTPGGGLNELALNTLDIVYGAFIYFTADGRITSETQFMNGINLILGNAHAKGVRIVASIGAQSSGSGGPIATIAQNANLRQRFADELLDFCVRNHLDGVDMDWEKPSSSNAKNYTELMKVIYNTFKSYDEELLVTSAIGAGPWQYVYYDLNNSAKYHDYINMMSYDMQSSSVTTHHNALYSSSRGYCLNNKCSIDATVKIYNSVGIPNSKIIIGIPFYGKEFKDSLGIGKSGKFSQARNQAIIRNILLDDDGNPIEGIEFWDDECKVPYIYIASEKVFITYDNPRSIGEKMKYAGENGIAGVMYWRHDQDINNILMTALNDNLHYLKER